MTPSSARVDLSTDTCRICTSIQTRLRHRGREMMFGLAGEFDYGECRACGSLWLVDVPDLTPYYPNDYYSFEGDSSTGRWSKRVVRYVVEEIHGSHFVRLFRKFEISDRRDLAILDVGSGSGALLFALRRRGYEDLTGVDPFLSVAIERDSVRVLPIGIGEIHRLFDIIIFNHSLEHVVDLDLTLETARSLLKQGGKLIVRIPTPNYAWRRFGVAWAALDAPRHVSLMTPRGLEQAAARAGFDVEKCVYDSAPNQFWASEAYQRGQTLRAAVPRSVAGLIIHVLGRSRWLPHAWLLNKRRLGDQAAFLLKPRI